MATQDRRRHPRIPYTGPIRLAWEDASGETLYVQARCLDVSRSGLRVEVSTAIPVRATVLLNADQIKLSGAARVKDSMRRGSKFILGLELNGKLREEYLSKTKEPPRGGVAELAVEVVTGVAD
jgi:hypothetical protein